MRRGKGNEKMEGEKIGEEGKNKERRGGKGGNNQEVGEDTGRMRR